MDVYFFNQTDLRRKGKRCRIDIEDLPQSLRFAHLNPKVAAYLANKERKSSEGDPGDKDSFVETSIDAPSLPKKLSEISDAVTEVHFEPLPQEEDVSAYLFKESKVQSLTILLQIAALLQYLKGHKIRVPKTLEYHLLSTYKDLIRNVVYFPRKWQTKAACDAYEKEKHRQQKREEEKEKEKSESEKDFDKDKEHDVSIINSNKDDGDKRTDKSTNDLRLSKKSRKQNKNLEDILEDEKEIDVNQKTKPSQKELVPPLNMTGHSSSVTSVRPTFSNRTPKSSRTNDRPNWKTQHGDWLAVPGHHGPGSRAGSRRGSRDRDRLQSLSSSRDEISTNGDNYSESSRMSNAGHGGYYFSVIQFALSSKACEEKGWIMHSDNADDKETVLEWAHHRLQLALRQINDQAQKDKEQGFDNLLEKRYYGDAKLEAISKYYRKIAINNNKQTQQSVLIDGIYPPIPSFMDEEEQNPEKVLFSLATTDGTTSFYYPSGRIAVIVSPAGIGKPGVYINAYDDDVDMTMLASFTPSGHGTCLYKNSVVRFLATEKGGHLADPLGAITKKWRWPSNPITKLPLTIVINMNEQLSFRCLNQSSMQLCFSCQKEVMTWCVAPTSGAVEPKEKEDFGHLMSGIQFSSLTAKEIARSYKLRSQQKPKTSRAYSNKQKDKIKSQLLDLKNQLDSSDNYELEADRDLARLQDKARNLMDEWLDLYRIAVGIKPPVLKSLQGQLDSQQKRISRSAHGSKQPLFVVTAPEDNNNRATSAPAENNPDCAPKERPRSANILHRTEAGGDSLKQSSKVEDGSEPVTNPVPELHEISPSLGTPALSLSAKSRMSLSSMRLQRSRAWACPVALRKDMLGEGNATCRCQRYKVPFIMDIEFDDFIFKYVHEQQLIIISIVSNLFPDCNPAQHMLELLYSSQNKSRTHPCLQSAGDTFRILLYDISSAAEYSNCTKPLLLRRHNVAAGMFLMYQGGKLVFCDHILNGYGNARKDFYKQIMKSKQDARMGYSLPNDFRFSPTKGHRGKRAAWGGEIGGAGIDKYGSPGATIESSVFDMPERPGSASSKSTDSRDILRPSFQIRSLTSDGFYPSMTPLPPTSPRPKQRATTAPLQNKSLTQLRKPTAPVR